MKNDIQELYDSIQIKKAMQDLHITKVSELKEYNCVTLANKLRTGYNKLMIIRKLNDLGYLPSAENAISIHDIPMSRKMRNIFLRNGIVYLAQLSAYPREEILQFRNVGEYAMSEIDTLCEKYGIQIRSLCPIKEAFSEFQFHKKIYPLFFRGNIFSVDDIRNKSAHDLYNICEQDYCFTMKTYHALRKNGVTLCGWNDQYLFEILPQYKSVQLFKQYGIIAVSQLSDCSGQQLKIISDSVPVLSSLIQKLLADTHMDKIVD